MNSIYDRLNSRIDTMLSGQSPAKAEAGEAPLARGDVRPLLRMAAAFAALREEAATPDPVFVATLRARIAGAEGTANDFAAEGPGR